MKEIYREIGRYLSREEEMAAAIIISASGSTPRGAGSAMLVKKDGSIRGSIGGGAVEYQAIQAALEVIREKQSRKQEFSLTRQQAGDIGMVCGGQVTVYFQYICARDRTFLEFCHRLSEALEKEEEGWIVLDITEETSWKAEFISASDETREEGSRRTRETQEAGARENRKTGPAGNQGILREEDGRLCFIQPLGFEGKVYIFGGGHVAQELVPVLAHVGFSCVVMDDREEFAGPEVFPKAERTIVGDLAAINDYVSIEKKDYVCVMTRGHQYDYYVQKQVMPLHPRYIGIMGSENKTRVLSEKLMEDGFSKEDLEFCHTPIGTAISAETPAEIAISIAGELIQVRAGGTGRKK